MPAVVRNFLRASVAVRLGIDTYGTLFSSDPEFLKKEAIYDRLHDDEKKAWIAGRDEILKWLEAA